MIGSKMRRKRSVQAENRRSHLDEHEELEATPEDADAPENGLSTNRGRRQPFGAGRPMRRGDMDRPPTFRKQSLLSARGALSTRRAPTDEEELAPAPTSPPTRSPCITTVAEEPSVDAEPLRVSVRSEAAATPLPEDEPEVEEPTNFVQLSHRVITDAGRALRESFATRPSLTSLEEVDEEEGAPARAESPELYA